MNSKPDGGCAYPCNWVDIQPHTGIQVIREQYSGMSIRQFYKAFALMGLLSNCGPVSNLKGETVNRTVQVMVDLAAQHADEMIKEDK